MAKRILYKVHCTPQEQVGSSDRYYLDSDCGRKLAGSYLLELDEDITTTGTLTSTGNLGAASNFHFIAVTATSISSGTVTISLDLGTTQIIELLEGECFASRIASGAQPYVRITNNSGSATVDYMTGT